MPHQPTPIGLPDPPPRPDISYSREASPSLETQVQTAVATGVELMVQGLNRTSTTSARQELQTALEMIAEQDTAIQPYVRALVYQDADSRNPVDHVYVSINPEVCPYPRPDVLDKVMKIINGNSGTATASWRPCTGPDKTRRLAFPMRDKEHANAMKARLETYFSTHGHPFQRSYVSKPQNSADWRVTFDFIMESSLDAITKNPPIIDRYKCEPIRPRLILPRYGLEIAIVGFKDVLGIEGMMNQYIREQLGSDAISYSRMAMSGDVYTVVLKNWPTTAQFINDDLQRFRDKYNLPAFVSISKPMFLYTLNSLGVPSNPAFIAQAATSDSTKGLQAQVDAIQQRGAEMFRSIQTYLEEQRRMIETISDRYNEVVANVSKLTTAIGVTNLLALERDELRALEHERDRIEDRLDVTPPKNKDLVQRLSTRLKSAEDKIVTQRKRMEQVQEEFKALRFHTLIPYAPPSIAGPPDLAASPAGHLRPEPHPDDEDRPTTRRRLNDDATAGASGSQPPSLVVPAEDENMLDDSDDRNNIPTASGQ